MSISLNEAEYAIQPKKSTHGPCFVMFSHVLLGFLSGNALRWLHMNVMWPQITGHSTVWWATTYEDPHQRNTKACITGPFWGNSLVTSEFPTQRASNAEKASIWRHHGGHYSKTPVLMMHLLGIWVNQANSLQWCHNGHDGISNHQPQDCLLNCLFKRRSKKTSKFRVTGLCAGNSPVIGEFPAQMANNAENVCIWWRHRVIHCWWYNNHNNTKHKNDVHILHYYYDIL